MTPASPGASAAARGSSKKSKTRCELVLRRALKKKGLRFRTDVADLPGRPDIVFPKEMVAIFCDGDFWHGRNWLERARKLGEGTNAPYWLAKIRANIERDERNNVALRQAGWIVFRFWETDLLHDPLSAALAIALAVSSRTIAFR